MTIFIEEFKNYLKRLLIDNYKNITLRNYIFEELNQFNYDEHESPLHNSVVYLNELFLKGINKNINLLEIGCGASSPILSSSNKNILRKDGLDIHEVDFRGINTQATLIGTVSKIPTKSNYYDYCISNQSIEHWYEYGVSISEGLSEICRVIKPLEGKAIINFPLFLHGKKEFVQGNMNYIIKEFSNFMQIDSIELIYSSKKDYYGWRRCKQPQSRVSNFMKSIGILDTPVSIVCQITGHKERATKALILNKGYSIKRTLNIIKDYSLKDLIIKSFTKLK